jgi:hypothetical protein
MSKEQQTASAVKIHRPSISTRSSITTVKSVGNGIPAGTVASRVRLLEDSSTSSYSQQSFHPISSTKHCHGHTLSRYGRRVSNRFGQPTSRNAQPEEERQDRTTHTYLGLRTPRTSHTEDHANSKSRSAGTLAAIDGQAAPMCTSFPNKYDTDLSQKTWARISTKIKHSDHELDPLQEAETRGIRSQVLAPTSMGSHSAYRGGSDFHHRDDNAHHEDITCSDTSVPTTSTTRRQDVRDLYYQHGISRPRGLVSSDVLHHEKNDGSRKASPHIRCHICCSYTRVMAKRCTCCEHEFCIQCDALCTVQPTSDEPDIIPKDIVKDEEEVKHPDNENHQSVKTVSRAILQRPGATLLQNKEGSFRKQRLPGITTESSTHGVEQSNIREKSEVRAPGSQVWPTASQPESRRMTAVKDSSFVNADVLCGRKLAPIKAEAQIQSQHYHSEGDSKKDRTQGCYEVTSSADNDLTNNWTHRSTANKPHSQGSPRAYTKNTRHLQGDTENGYAADSSYHKGLTHSYINPHPPNNSLPPASALSNVHEQEPDHLDLRSSHEERLSEYIECHCYPCTGLVRHKSPTGPRVIGLCQHRITDCESVSGQGVQHSVCCCVYEEHHAVKHHHHSPTSVVDSKERASSNPQSGSRSVTTSPTRTISTVVPSLTRRDVPTNLGPQQNAILQTNLKEVAPERMHTSTQITSQFSQAKESELPKSQISRAETGVSKNHLQQLDPVGLKSNTSRQRTPPSQSILVGGPPQRAGSERHNLEKDLAPSRYSQKSSEEEPKAQGWSSWIPNDKPRKPSPSTATQHSFTGRKIGDKRTATADSTTVSLPPIREQPVLPLSSGSDQFSLTKSVQPEEKIPPTLESDYEYRRRHVDYENLRSNSKSIFVEKYPRSSSVGPESKNGGSSLSNSRPVIRRSSIPSAQKAKNAIPYLNEKLLHNQQSPEIIEEAMYHNDLLEAADKDNESTRKALAKDQPMTADGNRKSRESSNVLSNTGVRKEKTKQAKHALDKDRPMYVEHKHTSSIEEKHHRHTERSGEHDCAWKVRFLAGQNGVEVEKEKTTEEVVLTGVTVMIHVDGREDLVIKADLREGAFTMVEEF